MVAQVGNNLKTHFDVVKMEPHRKLCVYNKLPLVELEWDQWDFRLKHNDRLRQSWIITLNWVGLYKCNGNNPFAIVGGHWASLPRCSIPSRWVFGVSTCLRRSNYFGGKSAITWPLANG